MKIISLEREDLVMYTRFTGFYFRKKFRSYINCYNDVFIIISRGITLDRTTIAVKKLSLRSTKG